jgi:hypothetical protein
LLQGLEAQRRLGGDSYPLPLSRLVDLSSPGASAGQIKKALAHPTLRDRLALVDAKKRAAPVALAEDRAQLASSRSLLEFLLRAKRKPSEHAFPIGGLLAKKAELYQPFTESLTRQIEADALPPTIGWMWIGKKRQVFFLEDVRGGRQATVRVAQPAPAAAPPSPPREAPADFARAFDEAFQRIDRHKGGHNFVSLLDLRRLLPAARAEFDAGLRQLRLAGRYTLSAAEGRHGVSPEEREAGVVEDGTLLLYVSSR